MTDLSKGRYKVWEKGWEQYVYTNRWIKIETEPSRNVKSSKKPAKTKSK